MVLESLRDHPKTGYELMKQIEIKNGKKPSPGSIYPLMKSLHNEGFIKPKEERRKKIYSLTKEGEKKVKDIEKERKALKQKHNRLHQIIDELSGEANNEHINFDCEEIMRNIDVFHELKENMKLLIKKQIFKKKEEKVREIIKDASSKLKKLK
ncbi:MAG: PadR family transcriptional regulator [Nanobdellota archaeon]